jgi:uncharacterized protein (TIGR03435 family)
MRRITITMLFLTLPMLAQQPAFEVATIKPVPRPSTEEMLAGKGPSFKVDSAQVTIRAFSLAGLLQRAYSIKTYQLSTPAWTSDLSTLFEIIAKIPEGRTPEQVPEMLQMLLKERFKLAVHRETKDMLIYALIVGKNGPKLKEAPVGAPMSFRASGDPRTVSHIHTVSDLSALAFAIAPYMDRPVLDLTGLKGVYDMDLDVSRDPEPGPTPLPLLDFRSGVEQLGLKLDPRKEPVEMIVVDHIEKTPTEN